MDFGFITKNPPDSSVGSVKCDGLLILKVEMKDWEQELVEDMIQIVTVFACRLQGKRATKAKKFVKELLLDDEVNQGAIKT